MILDVLINPHRSSNTYILDVGNDEIMLIDFGNYPLAAFSEWLSANGKTLRAVMLTHEHSDHCCGIPGLKEHYDFELLCSAKCAENIKTSKQNFSLYLEDITTFEIHVQVTVISEGQTVSIGNQDFFIVETPGHSPGGICVFNGLHVFTGDTILNGMRPPLSFPHSSKTAYAASIAKLSAMLKHGQIIHPGHGDHFTFSGMEHLLV